MNIADEVKVNAPDSPGKATIIAFTAWGILRYTHQKLVFWSDPVILVEYIYEFLKSLASDQFSGSIFIDQRCINIRIIMCLKQVCQWIFRVNEIRAFSGSGFFLRISDFLMRQIWGREVQAEIWALKVEMSNGYKMFFYDWFSIFETVCI